MNSVEFASSLNRNCHCIEVDSSALRAELERRVQDPVVSRMSLDLQGVHSRLFASTPVFVASSHLQTMADAVRAIYKVTSSRDWLGQVAEAAPSGLLNVDQLGSSLAPRGSEFGAPSGVFVSADFHLTEAGPRLIEMNTNAGGGLLALQLARAQRACCEPVARATTGALELDALEAELVAMFQSEYSRTAGEGPSKLLRSIAIVDEEPENQFLYPEMQLFAELFDRHGIEAAVVAVEDLQIAADRADSSKENLVARVDGRLVPIDLVYNRHTDFYLEREISRTLRRAWLEKFAVVTPNPWTYARLADKRNLPQFLEPKYHAAADLTDVERALLESVVPQSRVATLADAEELWSQRKQLFFKPLHGFGSRGAYDGKKITRKVFQQCLEENFLAQQKIPPSERILLHEGEPQSMKVDLRAIAYDGVVQFHMARLYRGQTTNLRTEGGGLATVFEIDADRQLDLS